MVKKLNSSRDRYLIDKLAKELVWEAGITISIPVKHLKKTIKSIVIWRDSSETFIPQEILISFNSAKPAGYGLCDLALSLHSPETEVPSSLYTVEGEGDAVLNSFIKQYKLIKGESWWESPLDIPRVLVGTEIDHELNGLKSILENFEVPVASDFTIFNGDPDKIEPLSKKGSFDKVINGELKQKFSTTAQIKAFAELCYEDPKRQAWLIKLAGK